MQDKIPPVKKRPETVHLYLFAVVTKKRDLYLMKQVEGMWEFPIFPDLPADSFTRLGQCRHTITHHRLDVSVYAGDLNAGGYEWKALEEVPISSLTRKIGEIATKGTQETSKT